MTQLYLNLLRRPGSRQAQKPYLRALTGLDRHALQDIGISEQEIAMIAPLEAPAGPTVTASGLPARWSLPGDWGGRVLSVKAQAGGVHPCEIIELPFYDKEKRIARGLDKAIPELRRRDHYRS